MNSTNPFLFIEFVITHKPDTDKLNKLQRLGINTVQIIIPKLPEEELEKTISKVSKVKWAYNEIESNTEYIRIPTGNSEGIPQIDEEQRKLFEESYKCRTAQINNLVRTINRSLESKQYKDTQRLFEQEIQRIEKATREHQPRLDDLQARIESEVYGELEARREQLAERRRELREAETDLESRYFKRREEITKEQTDTGREIEFRYSIGRTEDEIRREFGVQEADIDYEQKIVSKQEGYLDNDTREESGFESNLARKETELRDELGKLETVEQEKFRNFERSEQDDFNKYKGRIEPENEERRALQVEIENSLRVEFEGRYEQIAERISNRDVQSGDELSDRVKTILEIRGFLDSYENEKSTLERYREGVSVIKSGTWKEWN